MATLKEKSEEMARIKAELQRMEDTEDTTEENDGDLRDTLVERWQQLDTECKPIIERMEKVRAITRAAEDPANLEAPDGQQNGSGRYGSRTPELVTRAQFDPYGGLEDLTYQAAGVDQPKHLMMQRSEVLARCHDAVELEVKRNGFDSDFAEAAIRRAQHDRNVGEHILLTGSEEYQETFRAYVENPKGMAQRAALSLTLANGGYLLPFVLDQLQVA